MHAVLQIPSRPVGRPFVYTCRTLDQTSQPLDLEFEDPIFWTERPPQYSLILSTTDRLASKIALKMLNVDCGRDTSHTGDEGNASHTAELIHGLLKKAKKRRARCSRAKGNS
jgi:hypothetical protein